MKLGILFWFHRDIEVCANRLKMLRRSNPGVPVFGLYGGSDDLTPEYQNALAHLVDDFYAFESEHDGHWKWKNGDVMIAEWYRQRGIRLSWDTLSVVQWDMLVIGGLEEKLRRAGANKLLLSGLRPIEEVIEWWNWVTREADLAEYLVFLEDFRRRFGEHHPVFCCQFVFVSLPRNFLHAYADLDLRLGFLEYRLPTYASALGFQVAAPAGIDCWWPGDPKTLAIPPSQRALTAQKVPIDLSVIVANLLDRNGARVFHPFNREFPIDVRSTARLGLSAITGRLAARGASRGIGKR